MRLTMWGVLFTVALFRADWVSGSWASASGSSLQDSGCEVFFEADVCTPGEAVSDWRETDDRGWFYA